MYLNVGFFTVAVNCALKTCYLLPFNCGLAQGLQVHQALVPPILSHQFNPHTPFAQDGEPKMQAITEKIYPKCSELNWPNRELNLVGVVPNQADEVAHISGKQPRGI